MTADAMRWFWDHYLTEPAEGTHPHASPARADLSRLPPGYVITAGYDPLRDEGEALADRLAAAGVPVERIRYDDVNHGFMSWVGVIDRSDEALQRGCDWLRRLMGEKTADGSVERAEA